MKKLHPTQEILLKLLKENIEDPLTIRELQSAANISSTSVVVHHLEKLEEKGYLLRNRKHIKDYQLLHEPAKPVSWIDVYSYDKNKKAIQVIDRIQFATRLIGMSSDKTFLYWMNDLSMYPNISNNDLVLFKKVHSSETGSIIACINNNDMMIRVYNGDNNSCLSCINYAINSTIKGPDFKILGEMRAVLKFV